MEFGTTFASLAPSDAQQNMAEERNAALQAPSTSEPSKLQVNVGQLVLKAVEALQSLKPDIQDIQRYLSHHFGLDVKIFGTEIKNFLSSSLKSGLLLQSAEGSYRVAARRRRRSSGKRRGKASGGRKRRRSRSRSRGKSTGRKSRRSGGKRRRSRRRKKAAAGEEE